MKPSDLVSSLFSGRCEATVGNSPGEIEAITAAARSFLKSEIEIQTLKNPSFEFQLTSAVSCYSQASKLQEDQGRPQLAGSLNMELAEALWRLRRPERLGRSRRSRKSGKLSNSFKLFINEKVWKKKIK